MPPFLKNLLSSGDFMPHAHCYLWPNVPGLLWLHFISDMLIGLSYVAISATLVWMVYQGRRDIAFHSMFLAFGVFIIACGATHFMEVWTLWNAHYWLSGGVKAVTAAASVLTAVALPPLVPVALRMVHDARLSEERRLDVERANQELTGLYDKLKEFDELRTQFFANVSHELRTPLALILGPAEKLAGSGAFTEEQLRDLRVIETNARTLLRHVNDLLDVSKLEAGKMDLEYVRTDAARLVRLVGSHFDVLAEEKQIRYTVEAPEALPAALDPEKLQRVVLNLLSNAFKFTPAGGRVRCAVSARGDRVTIEVHDSGPGIAPEMREAVFERFRQLEGGATRRFGGTGLGLAIARDFVALHGGTISIDQSPEGGALFRVELPADAPEGTVVRREPGAAAGAAQEMARAAMEELRSRVETIRDESGADLPLVLVVEDNADMNRFVAETLSSDYHVEVAYDGQEGLEKALRFRPDLILSDVMMPRMSGDQLVREARRHPELDPIPIVMLTAKADDELRVQLLREGAQDYLMKPFSVEELRARVGNHVTMKRARDVLQQELASQLQDLEGLADEVTYRRRELQSALESTRVALEHAEAASQVKSNFLRLVSHELRTPLTSLRLQLQLLQRDRDATLTARQREILERISVSSVRLMELIDSLLEYTRIESGRLQPQLERTDLAALTRTVAEELRPQAEQKGLALELSGIREAVPAEADPRLTRLIVVNLVGNAIKFTEQGSVQVSLARSGGEYRLAVRDTGPGIPAERQTLIFEPWEHLEPVQHKHLPGVGLGLAVARELAEAQGGRIEVASEEGAGSTFTLVLPANDAKPEDLAADTPVE